MRWSGRTQRPRRRWLVALAWIAVVAFVVAFGFGLASWIFGGSDGVLWIDTGCGDNALGCNVAVEMLGTLAAIAVAFVYFTSWRIKRVIHPHIEEAATKPWKLVPTASEIEKVVGRDGLCEIIEQDLAEERKSRARKRRSRTKQGKSRVEKKKSRTQVIVAGVGDGKTAVLVKLTQYLFERGAVPVPIALRDAKEELDFRDLAKARFLERVGPSLLSEDEGDKVWRELCNGRQIVILADGLEEALPNTSEDDRAKEIRLAITKTNDADIPLVIATRPHAALKNIDVAIIRLEPLTARSVIDYIVGDNGGASSAHVEPLARKAEIMERPLYLRLARELHRRGKLADIPLANRVRTRWKLLECWRSLPIEQFEEGEVRMREGDRTEAVETAEQMACVALANNSLEVAYDDLVQSPYVPIDEASLPHARVSARHAEQLDLVESIKGGVRFRHSIMQAYLGSRRLPELVDGSGVEGLDGGDSPRYLEAALANPGRELTMALVMSCLLDSDFGRRDELRGRLVEAAEGRHDHTSFELLAAAYEIHALTDRAGGNELRKATLRVWARDRGKPYDIELMEAKLRAIGPIAEAGAAGDLEAYRALWQICHVEDGYAVRFQAAQKLGEAGAAVLAVMPDEIGAALEHASQLLAYRDDKPPRPDWQDVRRCSLLGWITPLLAVTSDESGAATARKAIEGWVALARNGTEEHPGLHLGVEAALAQGFKWEANRMPGSASEAGRAFLIDQALDLLEASRWWQTQVAVLQALALWALDKDQPLRSEIRKRIRSYDRRRGHPFVREVASQCTAALRILTAPLPGERGPSRHIWIDEVGVAAKIGPQALPADEKLRIPPAAGWHALAPRARQLVGDMLVLMNLVERAEGSAPPDADRGVAAREARRFETYKQGRELPMCLATPSERQRLTVDSSGPHQGQSCKEHGCRFGLCPYPGSGDRPFRGEFPETFCREQQRRLRGRESRRPPWTHSVYIPSGLARWLKVEALSTFWRQMERRNQG